MPPGGWTGHSLGAPAKQQMGLGQPQLSVPDYVNLSPASFWTTLGCDLQGSSYVTEYPGFKHRCTHSARTGPREGFLSKLHVGFASEPDSVASGRCSQE